MSKVAKRPATYDDLLKVPDHLRAEIVEGELYVSPRPAGPHGRTLAKLHLHLAPAFDDGDGGPGGWWIAIEPEVHLGRDVFVPDLAGLRRERVPEYPAGPAWQIAPDWICEVLSPSTKLTDRMAKMPAYAKHGVAWLWLVEPIDQTIEVFHLTHDGWLHAGTYGGDQIARIQPFEAIEIPLSRLWLTVPPAA